METVYTYKLQDSFEKDDFLNGSVKPSAVLKKFEKLAVLHAEILGVGFEEMLKKDLLWVVLRIKYRVINQPKPDEKISIETFPSGKTLLEFDRDFEVKSGNKILIQGTSKWCVIDCKSRRLARLDALENLTHFDRAPLFEGKFLKGSTFEPSQKEDFAYKVSLCDIDKNKHMNNKIYAQLVERAVPQVANFKNFQINFIKEAKLGDTIFVYTQKTDDTIFVLGKLQNGETSFFAQIK